MYTISPTSALQYVAVIGPCKQLGEVTEDGGLGDVEFNNTSKRSEFGYKIRVLYRILKPITLTQAIQRGYMEVPPGKYAWASREMVLDHAVTEGNSASETMSRDKQTPKPPERNESEPLKQPSGL